MKPDETVGIEKIRRLYDTETHTKRVLRELKILRLLNNSDNILKLYDIIPPKDPKTFNTMTIILDYLPCDLSMVFQSNQYFNSKHIQHIFKQILSGVQYMHSMNIAHCQLMPHNIRIDENCTIKIKGFDRATNIGTDVPYSNSDSKSTADNETKWQQDTYESKVKAIHDSNMDEAAKQKKLKRLKRMRVLKKKYEIQLHFISLFPFAITNVGDMEIVSAPWICDICTDIT